MKWFWPERNGPILADFHDWSLQLKKMRNTYQIWLKMLLFDGEYIEDCVKANTSNNQRLLGEK